MTAPYLTDSSIHEFIKAALAEDIGNGDHSSLGSVPESATSKAQLILKSEGIIAGIELAQKIFAFADSAITMELSKNDGDSFENGEIERCGKQNNEQ